MIITVTINPAIDKTIDINDFCIGKVNRISKITTDVGGKGINVSKTINAMSGVSLATGFIGGNNGNLIETTLNSLGIKTDFVKVNNETRTNTKIYSQNLPVTEINEQGSVINSVQINQLIDKIISYANSDALFVLAGSIPQGVPKNIYETITIEAKKRGSKVIMDADGELFKASLNAIPNVIKPNHHELAEYAGINTKITLEKIIEISNNFIKKGIELVAVSMGEDGSIFITKDKIIQCGIVPVEVHSTVGAGDAMVAGIAISLDNDYNLEKTVTFSSAMGIGAVTTVGTKPPTIDLVDKIEEQVKFNIIK